MPFSASPLGGLVASWPTATVRWWPLTAPGVLVLLDVITFSFHYPRLATLFKGPMPEDPPSWPARPVRAVLLLVAFLSALQAVSILAR